LKNLTHFGYSQVPELESKLKKADELLNKCKQAFQHIAGSEILAFKPMAKEALSMLEGE
jgi:hypothetical protein